MLINYTLFAFYQQNVFLYYFKRDLELSSNKVVEKNVRLFIALASRFLFHVYAFVPS